VVSATEAVARPARAIGRWAALGDSFTAGHDDAGRTWPDELAARLLLAGHRTEHRNLAVAGVTSRAVLREQVDAAIAFHPDLVTVVCGANDVVRSVRPDLAAFDANFRAILSRFGSELPEAMLVTATYPDVTRHLGLRPRSKERIARGIAAVNSRIRAATLDAGATWVELADRPDEGERSCFAADGLHASAEGHRRTAGAFADVLTGRLGIEITNEEER
jgi:phosphatidylinositol alpha 1,6-mannosyltransferase